MKCEEGHWIPHISGSITDTYYRPDVLGDSLSSTDPILEPPCTGGGAKLEIAAAGIDVAGAELICETRLGAASGTPLVYTVDAPNSCVLLCNYQLGWSLESNLDDEGVATFSGDKGPFPDKAGSPHVQFTDEVKCW